VLTCHAVRRAVRRCRAACAAERRRDRSTTLVARATSQTRWPLRASLTVTVIELAAAVDYVPPAVLPAMRAGDNTADDGDSRVQTRAVASDSNVAREGADGGRPLPAVADVDDDDVHDDNVINFGVVRCGGERSVEWQRAHLPPHTPWRVDVIAARAHRRQLLSGDASSSSSSNNNNNNNNPGTGGDVTRAFEGMLRGVVDVDGLARCRFAFRPHADGAHWLPLHFAWLDVDGQQWHRELVALLGIAVQ
jgi:hypothetical protein